MVTPKARKIAKEEGKISMGDQMRYHLRSRYKVLGLVHPRVEGGLSMGIRNDRLGLGSGWKHFLSIAQGK